MKNNVIFDIDLFVSGQLDAWALANSNYAALENVERKVFDIDKYKIVVQYNQTRKISTAANLSTQALAKRSCFLCSQNRPAEQISLPFYSKKGATYWVLVNPYPIFPHHLTIVNDEHQPQQLLGRIADMAELSELMPQMMLFFNGAKCGASAPDHMHFQASDKKLWPLITDFEQAEPFVLKNANNVTISIAKRLGRLIYKIQSTDASVVETELKQIIAYHDVTDEKINVMMTFDNEMLTTYLVPRKNFRPWQYSASVDEQLLISPASVEVGGIFITPVKQHFDKITSDDIQSVLNQVCFSPSECLKY